MLSTRHMQAFVLLLSSALTSAQDNPLCDGCNNCTVEGLCGNAYTTRLAVSFQDVHPNINSTRWQIQLDDVPSEPECYNLQALAVRPDLVASNFSRLNVTNANRFDSSTYYSQVVYRQGYYVDYTEEGALGDVVLQAYSTQDCTQDSDALADTVYTWSCAPGVDYSTRISIPVKSFSVRPTTDEDRRDSCLIANFERRSSGGSSLGQGMAFVLAVACLVAVIGLL